MRDHERLVSRTVLLTSCLLVSACAAEGERETREQIAAAGQTLAALPQVDDQHALGDDWDDELPSLDGTPEAYVAYALAHDHGLRAKWERWRAASHRIARERRMPMPAITYGVFILPVETRVGPQRHRLGVRQMFPWPGELLVGADAASAAARVEQREFEAAALELRANVLHAYWRLWALREIEQVQREQLELFGGLTELARSRLEIGQSTLADVQQLELGRARLDDRLSGLAEAQREAEARLIGAIAAPPGTATPTAAKLPELTAVHDDEASLRAALAQHPRLDKWQARAESQDLRVKEARQARAPDFSLGLDWIEVGPARMPNVADSGKDALSISVGIELPLWQSNYAEDQRAAEAEAAAARAEWLAARDRAAASLSVALSKIRDSARRARLHEHTLVPQAEGALESTLGAYAGGKASLASIILAERELLELRLALVQIHAEHALAWAELEAIVGRPVAGDPIGTVDPGEESRDTATKQGPG